MSYFYLILSLFREGVGAPLLKSAQRYKKFFIPANFSPNFVAFILHLVLKIPYFTQNYQTKPIASWNILQSLFFHLIQKFAQQLVTLLAALYPPQWFLNGSSMVPQWVLNESSMVPQWVLNGSSMSPHRSSSYYHPTTTLLPPYYHCTCIARPSTTLHPTIVRLSHVHLAYI